MDETQTVLIERSGAVATVTLNPITDSDERLAGFR